MAGPMIKVRGLASLDENDIVYEYGRSKVYTENGKTKMRFKTSVLLAKDATKLLEHFGEAWLANYLREDQEEIDRWADASDPG